MKQVKGLQERGVLGLDVVILLNDLAGAIDDRKGFMGLLTCLEYTAIEREYE
jgi:hypothetical protein